MDPGSLTVGKRLCQHLLICQDLKNRLSGSGGRSPVSLSPDFPMGHLSSRVRPNQITLWQRVTDDNQDSSQAGSVPFLKPAEFSCAPGSNYIMIQPLGESSWG